MNAGRGRIRRRAAEAGAVLAGVALMAACSSSGGEGETAAAAGESGGASAESAEKPDVPLEQLLLTDEVPGLTFEAFGNDKIMQLSGDLMKDAEVDPAECKEIVSTTDVAENSKVAVAIPAEDDTTVSMILNDSPDYFQHFVDLRDNCRTSTMTVDGSAAIDAMIDSGEAPEDMRAMFEGMDLTSTYNNTIEDWTPELSEDVADVVGTETVGDGTVQGTPIQAVSYRIVGVVDGITVQAGAEPYADYTKAGEAGMVGQIDGGQVTEEMKDQAKQRAQEAFDAQVKKIREA